LEEKELHIFAINKRKAGEKSHLDSGHATSAAEREPRIAEKEYERKNEKKSDQESAARLLAVTSRLIVRREP